MKEKIRKCMQPLPHHTCVSVALLILRLIMGSAFIIHGWGKIQNPMAWMGPQAPVPGFLQLLAAVSEFCGGIGLVLGLLTPIASLGIAFTMAVAVMTHMFMLKDPFVNPTGGHSYELALVYLGLAIAFVNLGAGKYSLDHKLLGDRTNT